LSFSYTPNRAVTIESTYTDCGVSNLITNGAIDKNDWEWAEFAGITHRGDGSKYRYKFIVESFTFSWGIIYRISCPYDAVSYLALNNPISSSYDYEWAFWGDTEYLRGNSRYQNDPKYSIDTNYIFSYYGGQQSFICPNGIVHCNDSEDAFFGTTSYINKANCRLSLKDVTPYS
jgi:hypothetical protein